MVVKLSTPFVGKPIYVREADVDRFLANGFRRVPDVVEPAVKPVRKQVKKK